MRPASDYDSQRRRIERELDGMVARDLDASKWMTSSTYPVVHFQDDAKRVRAYFLESCHTALTHAETMIAFRACLQAYSYAARGAQGTENDLLLDCRNRLEDFISAHTRCGVAS